MYFEFSEDGEICSNYMIIRIIGVSIHDREIWGDRKICSNYMIIRIIGVRITWVQLYLIWLFPISSSGVAWYYDNMFLCETVNRTWLSNLFFLRHKMCIGCP